MVPPGKASKTQDWLGFVVSFRPQTSKMPNNNKRSKKGRRQRRTGGLKGFSSPRNLFPQFMLGHGTYATNIEYVVPAATLAGHVFRLNSIYDPDYTSITGRSIAGFAQASVLYGKYRVFEAEVFLEGGVSEGILRSFFYAVASNDLTLGTDPSVWNCQRNVFMAPLKGGDGVRHRMVIPIHQVYGVPAAAVRSEDDFAAVMVGNPNNGVYLHIGMHNASGQPSAFSFAIRIVYKLRLELPTALA